MKSKAILVNQTTGYLMVDIVNAYAAAYDEVVLLAGRVEVHNRPLSPGVVIRPIIKYDKSDVFRRMITWLIGFLQSFFYLLSHGKGAIVIYVTNPPLSYFSALFLKNRFSIIAYDIYPDALKNIGVGEGNLIFRVWENINHKIFSKADNIFTLSEGMAGLLSKYTQRDKIKVIPNWGSVTMAAIPKSDNLFIKEHHLESKFVVMYSGNIGYTHNVETIVELAVRFRGREDVQFMVIGDGGKKQELMKRVEMEKLSNCTFLDLLPSNEIVYSLSAADLSVVTLTADTALVSVPSKTYNILSIGCPILCVATRQSEIGRLVATEDCGMCYEKHRVDEMAEYITRLKSDKDYHGRLTMNALNASKHYTFSNAEKYVY